jgi:hypothetical protein
MFKVIYWGCENWKFAEFRNVNRGFVFQEPEMQQFRDVCKFYYPDIHMEGQ